MDAVERLVQAFRARGATSSAASKLDALMELERLRDPRIAPFLLLVLGDEGQPSEVRVHVLKRLRSGHLTPNDRSSVAQAPGQLLSTGSSPELRMQAALALASDEPIDLRYHNSTVRMRLALPPLMRRAWSGAN